MFDVLRKIPIARLAERIARNSNLVPKKLRGGEDMPKDEGLDVDGEEHKKKEEDDRMKGKSEVKRLMEARRALLKPTREM